VNIGCTPNYIDHRTRVEGSTDHL